MAKTKDIKEEKPKEDLGLTAKQELFCQFFASDREFFGNGVDSYIAAYSTETKKVAYLTAKANASRMLTKANILKRINELLDLTLSSENVDKQLALVINQNADFRAKVQAIEAYNKLKGRIISKLEVTLPVPILGSDVPSNNSNKKNKGSN